MSLVFNSGVVAGQRRWLRGSQGGIWRVNTYRADKISHLGFAHYLFSAWAQKQTCFMLLN